MFPLVSAGNIAPHRFVKQSTAADNKCAQCGANDIPVGISQRGTRNAPLTGWDDGYAAIAGESLQIYGLKETCMLELGGTVTRGARLKSDADGKGVTASQGSGDNYGAIAGQSGTAGTLIEVQVQIGTWGEA